MTAQDIITVIVAVSAILLPALSVFILSVISKLREKVGIIEAQGNSAATAARGREDAMTKEIKLLREVIADKKATAGLLAQQVAQSAPSGTMPEVVVNAPAEPAATIQNLKP